jgi:hypothetical protein
MNFIWISLFLCLAPVHKPEWLKYESTTDDWISNVFRDAPPPGGRAEVICHLSPVFASQYGVWLVTAIARVGEKGDSDYHCLVAYYEQGTGESGLAYDKVVPEKVVKMFLDSAI